MSSQASDQLTIVSTVYHVPANQDDPTTVSDVRWSRKLTTKQEPFHRRLMVGSDQTPISGCWIDRASMIVVVNREGCDLRTIPTEEERVAIDKRVVELSAGGQTFGYVTPFGGPYVGNPGPLLPQIRLRCPEGTARVLVWVFPE